MASSRHALPVPQAVIEGQINHFTKLQNREVEDFETKTKKIESSIEGLKNSLNDDKTKLVDMEKVKEILSELNDWDMDVMGLAEATNGHPLYYVGFEVFQRHNFLEKFNIPEDTLHCFLCAVEASYRHNTFHNRTHAADVTHAMNYVLTHGLSDGLSDLDKFSAVVAAIVHDVDHPGTSNAFQVAVQSEVALRYNDKSVLENHHLSSAFNLMKLPGCNIAGSLPRENYVEFREILIAMVLATDLANHFDLMNKWKSKITPNDSGEKGLDMSKKEDKLLALQMGIKLADVNNQAKMFPVAERWSNLVVSEFFEQGDIERERNMKISPNCDRHTVNMPKSQVGFIDFIVKPLFENVASHFTELQSCVENIVRNREVWNSRVTNVATGRPGTPASRASARAKTPQQRAKTPAKKVQSASSSG